MGTLTEAERAYLQEVRGRKDELWTWLEGQPKEASIAIAMRIGFRILPFVVEGPNEGRFTPKEGREIASSLRYLALGRLLARRPDPSLDAFATLLNSIAYSKGTAATGSIREASSAAPSKSPLRSPADAARYAASRATQAAMFSATSPAGAPWDAIAADRAWIEAGGDPMILLDKPMWLERGAADAVPEPHASRWEAMRAALEAEDEGWRVWTTWYQDRMHGAPAPADQMEYVRITLLPDAMARADDPSPDGLRRWTADIEANRGVLKGSPRKANRVAATLIDELGASRP